MTPRASRPFRLRRGVRTLKRMKRRADSDKPLALEKIALAALTGWGQQEDRRRTAEAGFNHHLVKPPDPKALENVLAQLLKTTLKFKEDT